MDVMNIDLSIQILFNHAHDEDDAAATAATAYDATRLVPVRSVAAYMLSSSIYSVLWPVW